MKRGRKQKDLKNKSSNKTNPKTNLNCTLIFPCQGFCPRAFVSRSLVVRWLISKYLPVFEVIFHSCKCTCEMFGKAKDRQAVIGMKQGSATVCHAYAKGKNACAVPSPLIQGL